MILRSVSSVGILLWSLATPAVAQKRLAEIPQYVLDYAPVVHLFSGENYWPCDMVEHLEHTTPFGNYTSLGLKRKPNLDNLDRLNKYDHGRTVYLQSDDDPESHPEWLGGAKNKPEQPDDDDEGLEWVKPREPVYVHGNESWIRAPNTKDRVKQPVKQQGSTRRRRTHGTGGKSSPVTLVVVEKGDGIVDAFWFFFYSFNLGNTVFNVRFGNHVGDWEHTLVRFQWGEPKAVFLSQHDGGDAYSYDAVEKVGQRPVVYSATGTHAMYGTEGIHAYAIPLGLLHDETDKGPLWDPALNFHSFGYDVDSREFTVGDATPESPLAWIEYNGQWGDKQYPLSDKRQYGIAGQFRYVSGPLGPKFKDLDRREVCQGSKECFVRNWLPPDFEFVQHEYRAQERLPKDYDAIVRAGERFLHRHDGKQRPEL